MQGSSAISRRAWGIQEQHFSDWAACIWISAGARIWGTLLSRESNSPCKSHPSSAFLELSLLLVTSFHWPLRAVYFLEFFSFFLFPPLSGLWALFSPLSLFPCLSMLLPVYLPHVSTDIWICSADYPGAAFGLLTTQVLPFWQAAKGRQEAGVC